MKILIMIFSGANKYTSLPFILSIVLNKIILNLKFTTFIKIIKYHMEWILVIILLLFNGVFSCIEMAFASTNVPLLRDMASKGNKTARVFLCLKARPERTFAVIQVCITLVGTLSAALGGSEVTQSMLPYIKNFLGVSETTAELFGIALFAIPFTFFTVVVGELIPKAIAIRYPEEVSLASSRLLTIMTRTAAPVVHILEKSTVKFLSLVGIGPSPSSDETVSEISLKSLHPFHRDYILNLFALRFKKASEVMLPFSKVVTVRSSMKKEEIFKIIIACGHTRLPVLSDDTEPQVIGILHTKEFITMMDTKIEFSLVSLLRKPYFINVNESILEVLKEFQGNRIHMAIVRKNDQSLGIVTLEDIMEEVVGEIYDEDDDGIVKRIWSQRVSTRWH
ncbi:MAG: HlyC/CorC family transporter [wastewater metagenome]|nr:HlyC/CorC family transporter [Candidatus Loosdrechtia aerotolerans]